MRKKILRNMGPWLGLFLFTVALWVLHKELKTYHYHDVLRSIEELPANRLYVGLGLTLLNYLIMSGYDILALRYIQYQLPYRKIAFTSFIGYAFSNNFGLSMLAGGSVRYRLYSAWGLSAQEITKVVAFCSLTLWLGFVTLGGIVFLFEPIVIPEVLRLPFTSVRPVGILFLLLVGGYFLWSVTRKGPLRLREWEFSVPNTKLIVAQVVLASLDWMLAGSILFTLLPSSPRLSFFGFLGIYLLAEVAGLLSQIPGGLGVFETVVLLLLSSILPSSAVLGSLIAYRGIYYLLPLGAAAIMLGSHEVIERKEGVQRAIRLFGRWVPQLVPALLSATTFIAGVILLFSGATPGIHSRLTWLHYFLPLPVLEISHFLGSLTGMGLLLLARGLQRRLDAAYVLTLVFLGAGVLFSLLKGLDYEEASILTILLGVLLPCRSHFYRKASFFSQAFTPVWITSIVVVLLSSVWLGLFSYKHTEYSGELWWHFTLLGHASRFLRGTVGATGLAFLLMMARLLRPASPIPALSSPDDLKRAHSIVEGTPKTYAHLALLGDKRLLFSESGRAFLMYGVDGRSWVVLGNPVGPQEEWSDLIWRFREMSDRHGGWSVFYEVGRERLDLYLDLGLTLLKLGEEAMVPLQNFSRDGREHKGLRRSHHRLEREGCSFEIIASDRVISLIPELKRVSDSWLQEKNVKEKRFSIGFFHADYLSRFPFGVVRRQEKILAFANILSGAGKEELSIDLMRYLPEAPNGVMDYLFLELMLWGQKEGYRWFNLGMAPLSGLQDHALTPLWNRLGAFVFRHGEHFFNFQGLREYKEKFSPLWEPKYLASPGGLMLPRMLIDIASLISGGLKGVVTK
jgi:phosphatidylglycerol lysyltransferase